ncbi:MAG: 6-carboxytetrahydropterin synthase [Acidobacteria bacterium]|nr:6-carboxytetrahydropterin synthase [Acidobacteriota bacterium]
MIAVTRVVRFSAASRLYREDWTEERNREAFGIAARPYPTAREYRLEVTLRGDPDPVTGMVINLRDVNTVVRQRVVDHLENRYLNQDIPRFAHALPTPEALVLYIVDRLEGAFPGARLHRVRLWETEDDAVEWEEGPICSP